MTRVYVPSRMPGVRDATGHLPPPREVGRLLWMPTVATAYSDMAIYMDRFSIRSVERFPSFPSPLCAIGFAPCGSHTASNSLLPVMFVYLDGYKNQSNQFPIRSFSSNDKCRPSIARCRMASSTSFRQILWQQRWAGWLVGWPYRLFDSVAVNIHRRAPTWPNIEHE